MGVMGRNSSDNVQEGVDSGSLTLDLRVFYTGGVISSSGRHTRTSGGTGGR